MVFGFGVFSSCNNGCSVLPSRTYFMVPTRGAQRFWLSAAGKIWVVNLYFRLCLQLNFHMHSLALQVSICLLSFSSSGCVESTEESHSYGGHGQCHICYVLDVWSYHLPCSSFFACLRSWWCSLCHGIHSCNVQFRCEPNCVRFGESTVQQEDQVHDVLWLSIDR